MLIRKILSGIFFIYLAGSVYASCVDSRVESTINENIVQFLNDEDSFVNGIRKSCIYLMTDEELLKALDENPSLIESEKCHVRKARIEALSYKAQEKRIKSLFFLNSSSPAALTAIESYAPEYFERRKGLWLAALNKDHGWLPAIIDSIQLYRGGVLTISEYGSKALELTEPGSDMAKLTLAKLAENFGISTNEFQNVTNLIVKLSETEWQDEYIVFKNRLIAGLTYHSGELKKALSMYNEILAHVPKQESVYCRVSKIYKVLGEDDNALKVLQEGFQKFPKSSILFMCLAENKFESGDLNSALEAINNCLEIAPENPRAHIIKARVLADLKRRHDAMESCINAMRFCYGWGKEYLVQINDVLNNLNDKN